MSDTKITTVIFDLDGTLLDTLEDLKNATNYALKTCGMPERTLEEVRRFVGNGVKQLMCRAVPGGEDNPQFERAFDIFKEYYGVHCNDTTKAYDGIPELLQELKNNGYTMAIVSNKIDSAVQDLNNRYFSQVEVAIGDRENEVCTFRLEWISRSRTVCFLRWRSLAGQRKRQYMWGILM